MNWLINLLKAIGDLPSTFWGIIILLLSMRIATHYNADIGYYFAGVGSTLCGINHIQNATATLNQNPTSLKVETNAGDSTSKN